MMFKTIYISILFFSFSDMFVFTEFVNIILRGIVDIGRGWGKYLFIL